MRVPPRACECWGHAPDGSLLRASLNLILAPFLLFLCRPFRLADLFFPGSLQWSPLAASLAIVLESPILQKVEAVFNAIAPLLSRPVFRAERVASSLVVPQASF
jgi:hypothetical protein